MSPLNQKELQFDLADLIADHSELLSDFVSSKAYDIIHTDGNELVIYDYEEFTANLLLFIKTEYLSPLDEAVKQLKDIHGGVVFTAMGEEVCDT